MIDKQRLLRDKGVKERYCSACKNTYYSDTHECGVVSICTLCNKNMCDTEHIFHLKMCQVYVEANYNTRKKLKLLYRPLYINKVI